MSRLTSPRVLSSASGSDAGTGGENADKKPEEAVDRPEGFTYLLSR